MFIRWFRRQTVILMPNPWLCFWVNTPLGKQHSLNICLKLVIQASNVVYKSAFALFFVFVSCTGHFLIFFSSHLMSLLTGAHIGPEPTTDRFVVVMVISNWYPCVLSVIVLYCTAMENYFSSFIWFPAS
jgi:hypothetical protein